MAQSIFLKGLKKKINSFFKFSFVLLFLIFSSLQIFSFGEFEFTKTTIENSDLTLPFKSSSGTEVTLYINNNLIGSKRLISPERTYEITDSNQIEDLQIPIMSKLILKNSRTTPFELEISDLNILKTLNTNQYHEFTYYQEDTISYKDVTNSQIANIQVQDVLIDGIFDSVNQGDLNEGTNSLKFQVKNIYTGSLINEYTYSLVYSKYTNTIEISSYNSTTNQNHISVSGRVSSVTSPLFYVINNDGQISNAASLNPISLDGNFFNITVSGLIEGNNSIRFISTLNGNNAIFDGEKKISVLVDRQIPDIEITKLTYSQNNNVAEILGENLEQDLYVGGSNVKLNITTDAKKLFVSLNNSNQTIDIQGNWTEVSLNLKNGDNFLVLEAIDEAGNKVKRSHTIKYDNTPIRLEEVSPNSGEVHFFIQDFEGKVNKAEATIIMFAMPINTNYFDFNDKGERIPSKATCKDFEFLGYRGIKQFDIDRANTLGLKTEEVQVGLAELIGEKVETESDSDGDFKISSLILYEKSVTESEAEIDEVVVKNEEKNPKVSTVKSPNTICMVMYDKFGHVTSHSFGLTLDSGNTMWKIGEISTIPNTIYAAEIEHTGAKTVGGGNVRAGVVARFQYIGGGRVDSFQSVTIQKDTSFNKESSSGEVKTNEMNWRLDKNSGELIVYFPLEIKPMNKKPLDYPDEINLGLKARITYTIDGKDIPIDTLNPVYFQVKLNIEKPLDHTKWLSPKLIDSSLSFLNKSIAFTKKATNFMGYATVGGVLTCTGAKFWYGIQIASATDEQQKEDALRTMLMICDRVACTASPQKCEGDLTSTSAGSGVFSGTVGIGKSADSSALLGTSVLGPQGTNGESPKLAKFDSLKVTGTCEYEVDGEKVTGASVTGTVTRYEEESLGFWSSTSEKSQGFFNEQCVPANCDSEKNTCSNINLNEISGVCYSPKAPKFDDTRCNFFGLEDEGAAGYNPADNIYESIRCGCLTDTYSHLKNYLKIQEGIQKCLQEAKLGISKGSYCERLMGIAVCDIATNILFKTVAQSSTRTASDGKTDYHDNPLVAGLQGAKNGDRILNERYRGTFYSKAGLTTDQIVNKACIGALTGDWSVLTENILSSIDQNEIEPTFGPAFPTSRLQGLNPLTGDLSIMYRFTYAGISGGQMITTKVRLLCDKSQSGGEHCPDTIVSSEESGSKINIRTLTISKSGTRQDTIIATDTQARFRFNVLELTHTYSVKGEHKTKVVTENIFHKGELLLADCYFTGGVVGAGAGLSCDPLFENDGSSNSVIRIDKQNTHLSPKKSSGMANYFEKNMVYLNLAYDLKGDLNSNLDLAYIAECPNVEGGVSIRKEVKEFSPESLVGRQVENLFEIPTLGSSSVEKTNLFKLDNIAIDTNSEVTITVSNLNALANQNLNIKSFKINEKIVSLNDGILPQVLNVNSGGSITPIIIPYQKIQSYITSGKDDFDFEITLENEIEGVFQIEYTENNQEISKNFNEKVLLDQSLTTQSEFSNLKAGTCNLKIRLLPSGFGSQAITSPDFKTYNPFGEDIVNDNKQLQQDYFETTFTISGTEKEEYNFEITKPYEGQTLCFDTAKIEYIFNGNGENKQDLKLEYAYDLERYSLGIESKIKENLDSSKDISMELSKAKTYLDESSTQKAFLTYSLKNGEELISTKTINFYVSSCKEGINNIGFTNTGNGGEQKTTEEKTTTIEEEKENNKLDNFEST